MCLPDLLGLKPWVCETVRGPDGDKTCDDDQGGYDCDLVEVCDLECHVHRYESDIGIVNEFENRP